MKLQTMECTKLLKKSIQKPLSNYLFELHVYRFQIKTLINTNVDSKLFLSGCIIKNSEVYPITSISIDKYTNKVTIRSNQDTYFFYIAQFLRNVYPITTAKKMYPELFI